MQTLKHSIEECNPTMVKVAEIAQYWRSRLDAECAQLCVADRESITRWLLGNDLKRSRQIDSQDLDIAVQVMEYRYRILHQRYLEKEREGAYRNLIIRLGSLVTQKNKIQTWVALSRDRQRTVLDLLQEVLQELLHDSYMQQQMAWISTLTTDTQLRDVLLFATLEEYCLRSVGNQPLLVYRFVNYLCCTKWAA